MMLVLIIVYGLAVSLFPTVSPQTRLALHFFHALSWCIIHYVGLGFLLRAQSESKFLVRHYLKNYHYPQNDGGKGAIVEAFANWKIIYNLSMCMTYGEPLVAPHFGRSLKRSSVLRWCGLEHVLDS